METKGTPQLKHAYATFSSVDGLPVLCREFKAYVQAWLFHRVLSARAADTYASLQKRVQDIVKDVSKVDQMVDRLLEFESFPDTVLSEAFVDHSANQTNQDYAYELIDAFAKGFKTRRNKPAELIANVSIGSCAMDSEACRMMPLRRYWMLPLRCTGLRMTRMSSGRFIIGRWRRGCCSNAAHPMILRKPC